jgi:uncharacterized protein
MKLKGIVTNITNFGAFVDIGVHQDGLVHTSQMANRFVSNPNDIVKVSEVVSVTVIEIDEERKRISLSMKDENATKPSATQSKTKTQQASAKSYPKAAAKSHAEGDLQSKLAQLKTHFK